MARLTFNGKKITDPSIGGGVLAYSSETPAPIFDDWYLPSYQDLIPVETNLFYNNIGGFVAGKYASSSEDDGTSNPNTEYVYWNFGTYGDYQLKSIKAKVRPMRNFTDVVSAYSLGDVGPAGGWISNIVGGTTYYEVGPFDLLDEVYSNVTGISAGTTINEGTGLANSIAIVSQAGHTTSAAKLCLDYSSADPVPTPPVSFSDWYLPSEDELDAIYTNLWLNALGSYDMMATYMSSTQYIGDSTLYMGMNFNTDTAPYQYPKSNSGSVIAVRNFTDTLGAYALGDTGPASGLIFHVAGTTFYEATPIGIADVFSWKDNDDASVAGTSAAIGTGLANSNLISSNGAFVSAAKEALDYVS